MFVGINTGWQASYPHVFDTSMYLIQNHVALDTYTYPCPTCCPKYFYFMYSGTSSLLPPYRYTCTAIPTRQPPCIASIQLFVSSPVYSFFAVSLSLEQQPLSIFFGGTHIYSYPSPTFLLQLALIQHSATHWLDNFLSTLPAPDSTPIPHKLLKPACLKTVVFDLDLTTPFSGLLLFRSN